MAAIPDTEPTEIQAGDSLSWTKSLSDYPASDWVIEYVLLNANDKITITGAASGDTHLIEVSAATSAGYAPGVYAWQAYVTNDDERRTVGKGTIKVLADFAGQATYDARTHVKKTLDAIEAVIEGRASMDQQEYAIMGRSLKRTPMADLIMLRDKYKALYQQELNAESVNVGRGGKNRLLVRF